MFGQSTNSLLVSLPRMASIIRAFCFGGFDNTSTDTVIFLCADKVSYDVSYKPNIKRTLYVQPGCAKYYKGDFPDVNIIEKKL